MALAPDLGLPRASSQLCLPRPTTGLPTFPREASTWVFPARPRPQPWPRAASLDPDVLPPSVPVFHNDLWAHLCTSPMSCHPHPLLSRWSPGGSLCICATPAFPMLVQGAVLGTRADSPLRASACREG